MKEWSLLNIQICDLWKIIVRFFVADNDIIKNYLIEAKWSKFMVILQHEKKKQMFYTKEHKYLTNLRK